MPTQRPKQRFVPTLVQRQFHIAQRHAEFDEQLLRAIEQQPAALVAAQATPESRKLYNMSSQVRMEHMRLTCYLRLQIHPHGILWATHTPTHHIEDMILAHFAYRFPMYVIVLASSRGTFVTQYHHELHRTTQSIDEVLQTLARARPRDPMLQELKATDDDIWNAFYKSQYVPEKHNQDLFLKNVPTQFLKMDSFDTERRMFRKTRGLDTFFENSR